MRGGKEKNRSKGKKVLKEVKNRGWMWAARCHVVQVARTKGKAKAISSGTSPRATTGPRRNKKPL